MPSSTRVKSKPSRYKFGQWSRSRYRDSSLTNACSAALFIYIFCALITNGLAQNDGNDGTNGSVAGNGTPDTNPGGALANDGETGNGGNSTTAKANPQQEDDDDGSYWRDGRVGHGTVHEQVGLRHFQPAKYTRFVSNSTYTKSEPRSKLGMGFVYTIADRIFESLLTKDPPLPDGYVDISKDSRIYLGPKVKKNDWAPLLKYYWPLLLFVLFILILIVAMPFIAVCYCCFCCHRRCGRHCPPCDQKRDARCRFCYGFLLLLLLIGLLFGIIIAFVNNNLLENGAQESSKTIRRGSKDTCTFLDTTAAHLRHLYMNNYQEMETQLIDELKNADKHITNDLVDSVKGEAVKILSQLLSNMPQALDLMKKVDELEKEIRFYGSQLRDALRGVKRDINYIRANLCNDPACINYLRGHDIEFLDSGCLHYDSVPNSTLYYDAIREINDKKYYQIPNRGQAKLDTINEGVKKHLQLLLPPLEKDIRNGYDLMREQAETLKSLIDSVINDVNQRTTRSMDSFDDIYTKFGAYRNLTNIVVCCMLLLILFCLIIALLCGCCGKRPRGYRDDTCNKGTGATCLLIAMLLIFLTFSVIALIGLMYFVFSLLGHEGACAPLRDKDGNALFKKFDESIDLAKFLPKKASWEKDADSNAYLHKDNDQNPLQPIRLSTTIKACQANQSIYDVLQMNNLYDMRNLRLTKVLHDLENDIHGGPKFNIDFSLLVILTEEDYSLLHDMRHGNLSSYHSRMYRNEMCDKTVDQSLMELASSLDELGFMLRWESYAEAQVSIWNQALHLRTYENELNKPLQEKVKQLNDLVKEIDQLILIKNLNFQDSIGSLIKDIQSAEESIKQRGKKFITELTRNLTSYIIDEVERYRDMVIDESEHKVGLCEPLAYIYKNSVDLVCHRLVEPMSGFWFGTLLCCILFLPILWVAHKLQCLYKRIDPYAVPVAAVVGGDYLYDAYSDHDQIPMSSAHKKRRKGYERRREYDYYDDASPGMSGHAPAPANMRDSRYKDMAPQHWDSEPPRYHNPPMAPPASEYERPPPYYYPGAAEQD